MRRSCLAEPCFLFTEHDVDRRARSRHGGTPSPRRGEGAGRNRGSLVPAQQLSLKRVALDLAAVERGAEAGSVGRRDGAVREGEIARECVVAELVEEV